MRCCTKRLAEVLALDLQQHSRAVVNSWRLCSLATWRTRRALQYSEGFEMP